VSHRPKPDGWHPEASYDFVDDRTVAVAAGNVGGQALALGLVDEVATDVVPVVFGSRKRYFGPVDGQHLLEDPDVVIRGASVADGDRHQMTFSSSACICAASASRATASREEITSGVMNPASYGTATRFGRLARADQTWSRGAPPLHEEVVCPHRTTKGQGEPTPCHYQRIAHGGPCGKTRGMSQTCWPKPGPAEMRACVVVDGWVARGRRTDGGTRGAVRTSDAELLT